MSSENPNERDDDDDLADTKANDEEAQLLPSEEFEVDDTGVNPPPYISRQRRAWGWLRGPQNPQTQTINPLLASFQKQPIRLVERFAGTGPRKRTLLAIVLVLWGTLFASLLQ